MNNNKKYIPAPSFLKNIYLQPNTIRQWTINDKFPISEIKIDKTLFSFQNDVDLVQVELMLENFNLDFWEPIMINENYFLLDGQHRLKTAQKLGLRFIDTVIMHKPIYSTKKVKLSKKNVFI